MPESQNTRVVQDAYAAFGRGDIQGVLNALHDDVVWQGVIGASAAVPMSGERRGKREVADFFNSVGQHLRFSRFEPREFVAEGDKVVALGHYSATVSTGKMFESDFVMAFTLEGGKVVRFQEFLDVAALNAAFTA